MIVAKIEYVPDTRYKKKRSLSGIFSSKNLQKLPKKIYKIKKKKGVKVLHF
jgi:hypothetical protein